MAFLIILIAIVGPVLGLLLLLLLRSLRRSRRERWIDGYVFPPTVVLKLRQKYPHLTETQAAEVMLGLRSYFHICNAAGNRMVAMPSQAVDFAWHEFILFTRKYQLFCQSAFKRFLHHTPTEAMPSPTRASESIKVAWKLACQREQISPRVPTRLPLLFALDSSLDIPDGFNYVLDCRNSVGKRYCASHIACASGCSGGGCSADSGGSSCGGCGGD